MPILPSTSRLAPACSSIRIIPDLSAMTESMTRKLALGRVTKDCRMAGRQAMESDQSLRPTYSHEHASICHLHGGCASRCCPRRWPRRSVAGIGVIARNGGPDSCRALASTRVRVRVAIAPAAPRSLPPTEASELGIRPTGMNGNCWCIGRSRCFNRGECLGICSMGAKFPRYGWLLVRIFRQLPDEVRTGIATEDGRLVAASASATTSPSRFAWRLATKTRLDVTDTAPAANRLAIAARCSSRRGRCSAYDFDPHAASIARGF